MKRFLWACLGVVALAGVLTPHAWTQTPNASDTLSVLLDDDDTSGCCQKCTAMQLLGDLFSEHALGLCMPEWMQALRPAARREFVSNVLIGIHPLMAFVPTEGVGQLPGDHPVPTESHFQIAPFVVELVDPNGQRVMCFNEYVPRGTDDVYDDTYCFSCFTDGPSRPSKEIDVPAVHIQLPPIGVSCPFIIARNPPLNAPSTEVHYQVFPFVLKVVGPDGSEKIDFNDYWTPSDIGKSAFQGFPDEPNRYAPPPPPVVIEPHLFGVTCPYLVTKASSSLVAAIDPPEVLTNLQLLLRADHLLKQGEELARSGHFFEAVDCFQAVHCLVPGTNLESRASAATENIIVRVYGTTTEKGLVDEQSEAQGDVPPPPPMRADCTLCGTCVLPAHVAETQTKPRTMVYPVGDLLGKGKETKLEDLDDLINVVSSTVEPSSWAENGGDGTIEYYYRSRAIVVRQTPQVHEQIRDLLAELRQARLESDFNEEKPHRTSFATGRAVKRNADESIDGKKAHGKKATSPAPACGSCCEECCPDKVLMLPPCTGTKCPEAGLTLEIDSEGCTAESGATAPEEFCCVIGGTCVEACTAPDGLRVRWQIPLGPLTFLVEFQHHELTVDVEVGKMFAAIGVGSDKDSAVEESENPR